MSPEGRRRTLACAIALVAVVTLAVAYRVVARSTPPALSLAVVSRGDFVERLDLRGEVRPVRSVLIAAPAQAGDLLIVKLVRSGTSVNAGDVIAIFNPIVLRQQIQDKRGEVRQAEAEIDRTRAAARIVDEQNRTALLKAQFDVERAKLALGDERLMARLDYERARLDLINAEGRCKELERKAEALRASADADVAGKTRQREKVQDELRRLEQSLASMEVTAPRAGTVHLMTNGRVATPMSAPPEFREGDRVWAGAQFAELPDLSSVFVRGQLDEDSRGRLRLDQPAVVKVDAIPDREFRATIVDVSLLARVDFAAGFPPPRNFELRVRIDDVDTRLRPGMSATARIDVDRMPGVLLVPLKGVFNVDGRAVVYRLDGSRFMEAPVEIAKRNREQIAVIAGLAEGDRIAVEKPPAESIRRLR
jgi:multidrug efflux pump subunit AcrA (membrane-fusion protein)